MATQFKTRQMIAMRVARRQEFMISTGNLTGKNFGVIPYFGDFGHLPQEYKEDLRKIMATTGAYVVYSYKTPIGWLAKTEGAEWQIPNVTYSSTTTHHQSVLSVAILDNSPYLYDDSPAW